MNKLSLICCLIMSLSSCTKDNGSGSNIPGNIDFREEMRKLVGEISTYSHTQQSDFIIIPQNGQELLTDDGTAGGSPAASYIHSIDGIGREDLWYGYNQFNQPTPLSERNYMIEFLDLAEQQQVEVLVTDYCSSPVFVDSSYFLNNQHNFISFAASSTDLNSIPGYPQSPYNVNSNDIEQLSDAQNFLYLIDPGNFPDKSSFLQALQNTDYDLLIIDLYFDENTPLTAADLHSLKTKSMGGTRLVLSYMSIGEAEDYRYYWNPLWNQHPPSWLLEENPNWPGNYIVQYWDQEWKNIIYSSDSSYLNKIIQADFDGAYLDIIDAFEYFENQ
ncbi:MAG: hypothetical protein APR63_03650 [Desulfuromonas sp. SDB]|nr:MAG: hypothetical protein APR63_03650 [Desulfuromonas sp. SDB]